MGRLPELLPREAVAANLDPLRRAIAGLAAMVAEVHAMRQPPASPELVAEGKKRSAPIVEDWIKQATAKGVDAAKILAEVREEVKKVAAGK